MEKLDEALVPLLRRHGVKELHGLSPAWVLDSALQGERALNEYLATHRLSRLEPRHLYRLSREAPDALFSPTVSEMRFKRLGERRQAVAPAPDELTYEDVLRIQKGRRTQNRAAFLRGRKAPTTDPAELVRFLDDGVKAIAAETGSKKEALVSLAHVLGLPSWRAAEQFLRRRQRRLATNLRS